MKVIDLVKVYPNGFKAVADSSFGVETGQIFCLLGPNGAGKSTTFNILTSNIPKSSGAVKLLGHDIESRNYDVMNEVGICPQVNPFWDDLTVTEHLKIYALLKGMSEASMGEIMNYLLDGLHLAEHKDKKSSQLSGGNKRKLAVALSLIGGPTLQFLDEPSTGMDPVARKFLWNLLNQNMQGRKGAMVLTTHYMQEAESIADKIGKYFANISEF